ncbi:hypothetical protein IKF89_01075 [Candidatus Saccharibacteria bacterium]|nr:hypothetical protein [Candidatus Saccharibacteria bacterium]
MLFLPLCLVLSFFLVNDTFADVTDKVCKSLVARADTAGWDSPAVTVCAGKADDGGATLLISLGKSDNYYGSGANVSGVAGSAAIDVNDNANPKRGVNLIGNGGTGSIGVKGLNWWDAQTDFKAQDYDDPGSFIDAVLSKARETIATDTLTASHYVSSSGGETMGVTCVATVGSSCDEGRMRQYENAILAAGYNIGDCSWQYVSTSTGGATNFTLVCGGEPARTEIISYDLVVVTESDEVTQAATNTATNTTTDTGATTDIDCMTSGAINSLGWVVCPIIDFLSDAANTLYDDFVKPALNIEPELFNQGDGVNSATREGWKIFRDFANVIFVILFMVVIFSQLTGVGIDNYGIKKILPRLIVAAILINLSYWICLVFVDLSNIIGSGLQALFNGMADSIAAPAEIGGISIGGLGMGAFTAAVLLGILAVSIWSVWAAEGSVGLFAILMMAAVTVGTALLFLFLILAAREAAVVVLVMLSPLAVVCYMLPNTKTIFDRWLKMMKGLLLVYPICGLLVGGGNFVSKVLLAAGAGTGGFFSAFAAMFVGVAPIFFIPTVLKNSFTAMGNLGAKISGIGKSLGGRLSNTTGRVMQNSNTMQRWGNRLDSSVIAPRTMRAAAAEREAKRVAAERRRNRMGSREGYRARVEAAAIAADEAAWNEEVTQEAARIRSGGIMMDGADSPVAFTLDSATARMSELEVASRTRDLTAAEHKEMAALANMMAGMRGGASRINNIVRNAQGANGGVNKNFMAAMGQIYSQDAAVAGKMGEKDGTMASYMEGFIPGGTGSESYAEAAANGHLENRANSYEAGLNQGGEALDNYIGGLSAQDCQNIYDQGLESVLDQGDLQTFQAHAAGLGVTGSQATVAAQEQVAATQAVGGQLGAVSGQLGTVSGQLGQMNDSVDAVNNELQAHHAAASQVHILSHGAYQAPDGTVYHLREMSDGTYRDDAGYTVDITHFKKM